MHNNWISTEWDKNFSFFCDTQLTSCAGGRHNMPPPPASWPFDLEIGVTCDVAYTYVPILVFLGLSVLDLGPMYATDRRQTRIIA